jgi:hypothetical protein
MACKEWTQNKIAYLRTKNTYILTACRSSNLAVGKALKLEVGCYSMMSPPAYWTSAPLRLSVVKSAVIN